MDKELRLSAVTAIGLARELRQAASILEPVADTLVDSLPPQEPPSLPRSRVLEIIRKLARRDGAPTGHAAQAPARAGNPDSSACAVKEKP